VDRSGDACACLLLGGAEVLGAIGLILPGLLGIRPRLTRLAAAGLVIVMTGATAITALGGDVGLALVPLLVGSLAGSVAYGRWRLVPNFRSSRPSKVAEASPSMTGVEAAVAR
jgi:DoxX-like family